MNEQRIKQQIGGFISEMSDLDHSDISDDTPLLEYNLLDSMSMFALVAYLKDQFGIQLPLRMVRPENFSDISSIFQMVSAHIPAEEAI